MRHKSGNMFAGSVMLIQRLLVLLLLASSVHGVCAQDLAATNNIANDPDETPQTVLVKGTKIKKKGLSYKTLKSMSDMFKDAAASGASDLSASLVWLDYRPSQRLMLITAHGEQPIAVSPHGVFELPPIPEKIAGETYVQPEDNASLVVRPGLLVKQAIAQTTQLETLRRLVIQGNEMRRHLPWYMKVMQFGRTNAGYAGLRVCFAAHGASAVVGERRLQADASNCIKLLVKDLDGYADDTVIFESPPLFAELITSTMS